MRPFRPADALKATLITGAFPQVHGAPIHQGNPAEIGIADINHPDYGDAQPIHDGELPVFWACGVTPQSAVRQARPPLCITHTPGHMLVTDIKNASLAIL